MIAFGCELVCARGALLERVLTVTLEHQGGGAPDVDLGYHAEKSLQACGLETFNTRHWVACKHTCRSGRKMAPILTAEDVVRRIAAECAYVDERGAVVARAGKAETVPRLNYSAGSSMGTVNLASADCRKARWAERCPAIRVIMQP